MEEKRSLLKVISYIVIIGGSAVAINWLYQNLVQEWSKKN